MKPDVGQGSTAAACLAAVALAAGLTAGCDWFDDERSGAARFSLTPESLTLVRNAGGAAVSEITQFRYNGPGALVWTATATTATGSWLSVVPPSGAIGTGEMIPLTVTATPGALLAGVYTGEVCIAFVDFPAIELVLPVTFYVGDASAGTSWMASYVSKIDGSIQPYRIRLPAIYTGPGSYPLAVNMHGYGGHATTSFGAAAVATADEHGWILVNVEGRGNHQYDGAAETDLFEVIEDVDADFGVDHGRIYLAGHSMGGTGSFRFIARHPDVFAGAAAGAGWNDHRQWHRHYYGPGAVPYEVHPSRYANVEHASAFRQAANILPGRLYFSVGGVDGANWAENGLKLERRLVRLGTTYTLDYAAGGTHGSNPPHSAAARYAFLAARAPLDLDPPEVRIRANRLRTAKHAWFQVERFIWDGFAEVSAVRSAAAFDITARNVERFTIGSAPVAGLYAVTVNGVGCGSHVVPVTIELVIDAGGAVTGTEPVPAVVREKTPSLEGPVGRAFTDAFIVAYGSLLGPLGTPETDQNKADAEEFCRAWTDDWIGAIDTPGAYGFNAVITPVDEVALGSVDLNATNLVIFGSEESSSYVDQMINGALPFNLPVSIVQTQITVDGQSFTVPNHGLWMAYPNPLAPARLVVVGFNVVGDGGDGHYGEIFWTQQAYSWMWPDYVVFDTAAAMRPEADGQSYTADQYVLAGTFDRDWALAPPAAPETRVAVVAPAEGASVAQGTPGLTVTVTVEDELSVRVMGLAESAFDVRVDGEALPVTFHGDVGIGRYEWTLDVSSLIFAPSVDLDQTDTTYDITVEVVRPGASAPVVGIGRTRFVVY